MVAEGRIQEPGMPSGTGIWGAPRCKRKPAPVAGGLGDSVGRALPTTAREPVLNVSVCRVHESINGNTKGGKSCAADSGSLRPLFGGKYSASGTTRETSINDIVFPSRLRNKSKINGNFYRYNLAPFQRGSHTRRRGP